MKTTNNIKDILDFKSTKTEANKSEISDALDKELLKFDFDEDYLKEGNISIESCYEIKFHTSSLENYTDTRDLSEGIRPNISGVPMGKRQSSEFNVWDYKLVSNKEFQNDTKDLIIENSHHAIGCSTCKQHGKIRCSRCSGAGENTCSSCSGRGENQCSGCSGKGQTRCWSCSGKGTTETGYGDNKRTQRCSSCYGQGYKICSSCRNGYITCSPCSGKGKVTCYTCQGSGEVTCYQCDGYRTMDHYFIVTADFENLSITQVLTNPSSGFDLVKAENNNFDLKNKLFEITEKRFNKDLFDVVKSHPLYRQIISFFDFQDDNATKLIASKISFFENTYTQVIFTFYGEKYTLFFDKKLENTYYLGKKPSDQYELDLLNKALKSALDNDLEIAKKSIFKLSKYDFIKINEDFISTAISDTESIYDAHSNIENKKYSGAESNLRLVSEDKKLDDDYKILFRKLSKIYFLNTTIFGLIGLGVIFFQLLDNSEEFRLSNFLFSIFILGASWLINIQLRSMVWSRLLVISLFAIQFFTIQYFESKLGPKVLSDSASQSYFDKFKKEHYTIFTGKDSVILLEPTGSESPIFYLPKGKSYITDMSNQQRESKENYYLEGVTEQDIQLANDKLRVPLRSSKETKDYIIIDPKDIAIEQGDKFIEVTFMKNSINEYKTGNKSTIWIKNSEWESIKNGEKSYKNISSSLNSNDNEVKPALQLGAIYQGGIIVYIDETGEHGLIMSAEDLGDGTWSDAIELCSNYSQDAFDDWRLPTIEELRLVYSNKSYADNFPQYWYWSSTEDPENSDQSYFLDFSNGNEMNLSKDFVKYVRAIRSF